VIGLIYGPDFDAAVPVLQVLAWTVCLFSIALVFARVLVASHNEVLDLYCNVAALLINAVLGWQLILRYGPLGAGISALVSLAAFALFEGCLVARHVFKFELLASLARAGCAAIVMAIAVRWLDTLPLVPLSVAGAAVYVCTLVCLGTFSRAEVRITREIAATWLGAIPFLAQRRIPRPTEP
jgi:O-antigen/teichoic acid export membrane protein